MGKNVTSSDVKMISVEKMEPNDWNPQTMTDTKFNELVDEIRNDGFDDPPHLVPHPDPTKRAEGIYMIIDGEHRWQAARVLGLDEIPCVIKEDWTDESTQKIKTVRRNLLRGDLDKMRFSKLVRSLNDTGIPLKDMPSTLGFNNEQEFREKFVAQEREKEEQQRQSATREAKEEEKRENAIVNNLSFILNEIFSQYGDTVPQGFIFFCHRNKFHLLVQMDDKMEKQIQQMVNYLRDSGKNINPFMRTSIDLGFDKVAEEDGTDPRKTRAIKSDDDDLSNLSDVDSITDEDYDEEMDALDIPEDEVEV